jgi:glutamyl-Q tRNA(Asp) synthetase
MSYRGRFAPSPTGPLHAGSLVAALASWLDARAHNGCWLIRIEDVDRPRCPQGMGEHVLAQLAACSLHPDEPPVWQSSRDTLYDAALRQLIDAKAAYPCSCTRSQIQSTLSARGTPHQRFGELIYPGTCRNGLQGGTARAWRLRVDGTVVWQDRRLGPHAQDVSHEVGDFILKRADGLWAYQLAVVVDDAHQGISHVVRGEDLADNTPRQMLLQQALGVPTPKYLHTPLVRGPDGQKLSKQNGACALNLTDPLQTLRDAGAVLGLPPVPSSTVAEWLAAAVAAWAGMIRFLNERTSA